MTRSIAIYGTGAHARKTSQLAQAAGWTVALFLDDAVGANSPMAGIECAAGATARPSPELPAVFVAIGQAEVRALISRRLREHGWRLPSLVHPKAWVSPDARLGEGVLVAAMAVVETAARVGDGVIVDIGALIDHDAIVGAYSHVRPGQVLGAGVTLPSPLRSPS